MSIGGRGLGKTSATRKIFHDLMVKESLEQPGAVLTLFIYHLGSREIIEYKDGKMIMVDPPADGGLGDNNLTKAENL